MNQFLYKLRIALKIDRLMLVNDSNFSLIHYIVNYFIIIEPILFNLKIFSNLIYRFVLEIHFKIIFKHILYYYWCFDVLQFPQLQVSYKPCSYSLLDFFNQFQFIILYSCIVPMTEYHIHNWILNSAHYFHLIHRIKLFAK